MLESYIAERDGWLFVVTTSANYDTPIIKRYWYPVGVPKGGRADLIGKEVLYTGDHGLYRIHQSGCEQYIRLENGGKTKAKYIYEVPLKPPRGKEVIWRSGKFYKYTKTHGEQCMGLGTPIESETKLVFPQES